MTTAASIPMVQPLYSNMTAFEANQARWAAKRAPKEVSAPVAFMISRPVAVLRILALVALPVLMLVFSPSFAFLVAYKLLLAMTGFSYTKAEEARRVNRFHLAECIAVPATGIIGLAVCFI